MSADAAVIIIDAQEFFRHRPFWSEADLPVFIDRMQHLHDGAP